MKAEKNTLTPFEWKVLKVAMGIPFGQTRSYQWVADKTGNPKSARAVGQALRKNPYPVLIPCHRVIRSDGSLGGYAGKADNSKKSKLIDLEKKILSEMKGVKT